VTLRPRLGRRIVLFAVMAAVTALGVVVFREGGVVLVVLCGPLALLTGARLVLPDALTTELGPDGIETRNSFGRPAHRVSWQELGELEARAQAGPWGAWLEPLVAIRCDPRRRRGRADVVLPDPYGGFEATIAAIGRAARSASAPPSRPG
jgi:hypothetical protein